MFERLNGQSPSTATAMTKSESQNIKSTSAWKLTDRSDSLVSTRCLRLKALCNNLRPHQDIPKVSSFQSPIAEYSGDQQVECVSGVKRWSESPYRIDSAPQLNNSRLPRRYSKTAKLTHAYCKNTTQASAWGQSRGIKAPASPPTHKLPAHQPPRTSPLRISPGTSAPSPRGPLYLTTQGPGDNDYILRGSRLGLMRRDLTLGDCCTAALMPGPMPWLGG